MHSVGGNLLLIIGNEHGNRRRKTAGKSVLHKNALSGVKSDASFDV
jgi:ABC-type uncharacterized transport system YnjBCD ATPase subunit